MNDLQKKYVAVLRANGHRQCKKRWFDGDKCCAIGLLTETIYPEYNKFTYWHIASSLDRIKMLGRLENYSSINFYQACLLANLKIAKLNDSGKTFSEIADMIESNPLEFFEAS